MSSILATFFVWSIARSIPDAQRFDCHPEPNANQNNCEQRGCIWNATTTIHNEPACFYPSDWGYTFLASTPKPYGVQYVIQQNSKYPNPYGQDISTVNVECIYDTNQRLRIRMTDEQNQNRYEPPIPLPSIPSTKASNPIYRVTQTANSGGVFGFNFSANYNSKSAVYIGTTAIAGFAYSNQFIQFMFGFNSAFNSSFGWGERYSDFILPMNYTTITSFALDVGDGNSYHNSYGVHPFMLNVDPLTGYSFGILIVNSNCMQIMTTPYPALQYQTIGGIIDMFVFFGATPSEVIRQYWDVIGKPFLPPLWSLGFHLCRYCYNSVNRTRYILEGMVNNSIPYDTQWNDIDYMHNHLDFTYDPLNYAGFPQFVDDVHNKYQMKYVHIIDPGIANTSNYAPFTEGVQQDAFVKDNNGDILYGKVWPGITAYPDFWSPNAKQWWAQQAINWKKVIDYNGWWIDMNEPSNFVVGSTSGCPSNNQYENPPYLPKINEGSLATKTICMTSKQHYQGPGSTDNTTMHYNIHSLYGLSEMIATAYALNQTHGSSLRNFIISRSTYLTAGRYGGHWTGDNNAQFIDMQISVTESIEFNMFGIPMVGADICGFNGDTTIELCSRWMALGAFYPFSRNHNTCGAKPQDPPSLGEPVVSISRRYLQVRYQILPYLYTLFFYAHTESQTVMRSLWLNDEFAADPVVYTLVNQFMLGSALLISPQLQQGRSTVNAYFPDNVRWYNFFGGNEMMKKGWVTLSTPLPTAGGSVYILPVHIKGGEILTLQELNGALTTQQQAPMPYQLLVTLNVSNEASGRVVIDDGVSVDTVQSGKYTEIQYSMAYNADTLQYVLKNEVLRNGWTAMQNNGTLNEIVVYGLNRDFSKVANVSISPVNEYKSAYNATNGVLTLSQLKLNVNVNFVVSFDVSK